MYSFLRRMKFYIPPGWIHDEQDNPCTVERNMTSICEVETPQRPVTNSPPKGKGF